MYRQYILVAHRSGAKLFERKVRQGFSLLKEFTFPEGRRRTSRQVDGTISNTSGRNSGNDTQAQNAAVRFAKTLGRTLETARSQGKFDRLILVAEPRFLGVLKGAMTPHTLNKVTATLARDFKELTEGAVFSRLRESLVL